MGRVVDLTRIRAGDREAEAPDGRMVACGHQAVYFVGRNVHQVALADFSALLADDETRNRSWVEGSTVLIGDAAYVMAPNLGQGGCTALHSAVTLAGAVDGSEPIERALQRRELAERPYVDYVQTWSHATAGW
jgi:2-polyprenyl-6-methoxyphenol hydroxylase-like FAD-dependent oxidoreductase